MNVVGPENKTEGQLVLKYTKSRHVIIRSSGRLDIERSNSLARKEWLVAKILIC